jgi:hypothetical protein
LGKRKGRRIYSIEETEMTPVTYDELLAAFGFLVVKLIDMDIKTSDGHDICPLFGFCEEPCGECFLDRCMDVDNS